MNWEQRELEFKRYFLKDDKYQCIDDVVDLRDNVQKMAKHYHTFVVQYTGVKDVKGVKIFEGDIVEVLVKDLPILVTTIGIVEFINGQFKIVSPERDIEFNYILEYTSNVLTILGNVFQNPELVEKYKLKV